MGLLQEENSKNIQNAFAKTRIVKEGGGSQLGLGVWVCSRGGDYSWRNGKGNLEGSTSIWKAQKKPPAWNCFSAWGKMLWGEEEKDREGFKSGTIGAENQIQTILRTGDNTARPRRKTQQGEEGEGHFLEGI